MKKKSKTKFIMPREIDIEAGEMTYGQRIKLGKIFQNGETSEAQKFEQVFQCLHKFIPLPVQYKMLLSYFERITAGLKSWIEKEQSLLKYEPTADEISAGIGELAERIGEFGVVKALAKDFGKDPDEILKWEYAKVFGILFSDLEESKFHKRYMKVIDRKYKK